MGGACHWCRDCGKTIGWLGICVPCAYKNLGVETCAQAQEEKEMIDYQRESDEDIQEAARVADLRERWDRAFYAALTGFCMNGERIAGIVEMAEGVANETIRRHAELMAGRDAAIAEVVG